MKLQRVYQFLVVLLLILPLRIFSQQQIPRIGQNSPHGLSLSEEIQGKKFQNNIVTNYAFPDNRTIYRITPGTIETCFITGVKSKLTIQNLPFFCKEEYRFEKTTSIPLRIRLGSLDYVNNLEGKK
jgi:hypothetical protein